ncbi:hypothetical protein THRCLA_03685 [Thraustotheca clavata]|uniref:VWFA domain-containing protein n=1 Tax=Thraustotheca clavata TaxID=74557 RepID=A0A1W0A181_9STRA|nr:hypothetical protein THRCLA_03685 [Thraustotheca clavata]
MSRSKEAMMIVLDASASMREPLAEITRKVAVGSRFDAAKTAVQSILSQKMLFRKHDEVGIVMYGTEDTENPLNEQGGEYEHVKVLTYLDEASTRVAELMAKAEPATVETKADLLDGIIVALDIMIRRTEKKKYEKRLVVITDAATPINNPADMEVVCSMIKNMEVELQIMYESLFFEEVKEESIQTTALSVKDESMETTSQSVKVENEKMLHSIAQEVSGEVISVTKRIDFLTQGKTKTVSQSTKFRGNLEFGDTLQIPVYVFSKTLEQKMPTLAKESAVADPGVGKVKMDRLYHSQVKPDEEVPPESRIKAYKYGSEMIPFSTADQASLKLATERSLKVLGFIKRELIDQTMFMGSTDAVFGDFTKPRAQEALAAFVRATEAEGKVALARFVWRANAAPKIVVLIPNAYGSLRLNCFWMQVLPFEEDLRQYEFPSLRIPKAQPTKEQQDIADALVDSLTLSGDKQNLHEKAFCPSLQRFYDTVPLRALDPACPLASLPAYVERYVREDKELFSKALPSIEEFNVSFQLKEAVKAKDKKKKFFWSDTNKKTDDSVKEEVTEDATPDEDEEDFDLDDLLGGEDITSVGSMNPISDFEALLSAKQNKVAKAHSAVTGMQDVITTLFSQDAVYHSKALQCLKHFRRRSPEVMNRTSKVRQRQDKIYISAAWSLLVSNEMSLICSKDDPSCDVTPSEAYVFLHGAAVKEEAPVVVDALKIEVEEDDLFADLE